MRRVHQSELLLDKPLPWSLYDEGGNLLLRAGYVISIPRHLSSLLKRGAYVQTSVNATPTFVQATPSTDAGSDYVFRSKALLTVQPVFGRAEALAQTLKRLHAHLQAQSLQAELRTH